MSGEIDSDYPTHPDERTIEEALRDLVRRFDCLTQDEVGSMAEGVKLCLNEMDVLYDTLEESGETDCIDMKQNFRKELKSILGVV